MYRYKYKLMKQIRMCKDLKHLIYYRFNTVSYFAQFCCFFACGLYYIFEKYFCKYTILKIYFFLF